MRLATVLVALLVAGCDMSNTSLHNSVCTDAQMDKAQRETIWCSEKGGYVKSYCYEAALRRNCEVRNGQVKEKFGGLRFYLDSSATEKLHDAIRLAEDESYKTCELCGEPGEPRREGWIKTLCDKHDEERKQRLAKR